LRSTQATILDLIPAGPRLREAKQITWPVSQFKMSLARLDHVFATVQPVQLAPDLTLKVISVAVAVGANGPASLRKTGCQGILLRGEVLFIEVDAKALSPLKTTSIHNAARMVESCATNPISGGPARKPT